MIFDCKTRYCDEAVQTLYGRYENGRLGIMLVSASSGEPIYKVTVNIPDVLLPENHVHVKTWSENEDVLDACIQAGLLEDTGDRIQTGHVAAALCKLTERGLQDVLDEEEP